MKKKIFVFTKLKREFEELNVYLSEQNPSDFFKESEVVHFYSWHGVSDYFKKSSFRSDELVGVIFYIHDIEKYQSGLKYQDDQIDEVKALKDDLRDQLGNDPPFVAVLLGRNTLSLETAVALCREFLKKYPKDDFVVENDNPVQPLSWLRKLVETRKEKETRAGQKV